MTLRIFNMENLFNVKGKNHGTKPVNISTIKKYDYNDSFNTKEYLSTSPNKDGLQFL